MTLYFYSSELFLVEFGLLWMCTSHPSCLATAVMEINHIKVQLVFQNQLIVVHYVNAHSHFCLPTSACAFSNLWCCNLEPEFPERSLPKGSVKSLSIKPISLLLPDHVTSVDYKNHSSHGVCAAIRGHTSSEVDPTLTSDLHVEMETPCSQ